MNCWEDASVELETVSDLVNTLGRRFDSMARPMMVVLPPSTRPGQISAQSIPRSNDFYVPVINLYYPCKTILSAAIITTHSNTIAQLRVHPHVEHLPNVSVARSKIHGVIDFRTRLNTKAVVNVCNLASQTSKVSRSKAGGITLAALDIPCLCAGRKK